HPAQIWRRSEVAEISLRATRQLDAGGHALGLFRVELLAHAGERGRPAGGEVLVRLTHITCELRGIREYPVVERIGIDRHDRRDRLAALRHDGWLARLRDH